MSNYCIKHIENYWKVKTTSSNKLFNIGGYKDALAGYQEALYRAEVLMTNYKDCIRVGVPFVQVYIISCNNIAYTYEGLKQYDEAENMLRQVLYYLLYLEKRKILNNNMIQSELKRAALAYINFMDKNKLTKFGQERTLSQLKERFVTT